MVSINLTELLLFCYPLNQKTLRITALVHCEEALIAKHTTPLQVMEVMQEQQLLWQYPAMVDGH